MKILQPRGWPKPAGYANGVAASGTLVFVAGQVGWNTAGEIVSNDLVEQIRQALANVVMVLAEGGARPEHITRMTWYLTNRREYLSRRHDIGIVFRELVGAYHAAMTAVEVTALIEDHAKVEIEVTAVVPQSTSGSPARARPARKRPRRASTSRQVSTRSKKG